MVSLSSQAARSRDIGRTLSTRILPRHMPGSTPASSPSPASGRCRRGPRSASPCRAPPSSRIARRTTSPHPPQPNSTRLTRDTQRSDSIPPLGRAGCACGRRSPAARRRGAPRGGEADSGGVLLIEQSGPEAGEAGAHEWAVECVQDGVALDVAELGRQRPDGEGALDPFGGVEQAVVAEAPDELDGVESSHGDARQVDVVPPVHAGQACLFGTGSKRRGQLMARGQSGRRRTSRARARSQGLVRSGSLPLCRKP